MTQLYCLIALLFSVTTTYYPYAYVNSAYTEFDHVYTHERALIIGVVMLQYSNVMISKTHECCRIEMPSPNTYSKCE